MDYKNATTAQGQEKILHQKQSCIKQPTKNKEATLDAPKKTSNPFLYGKA